MCFNLLTVYLGHRPTLIQCGYVYLNGIGSLMTAKCDPCLVMENIERGASMSFEATMYGYEEFSLSEYHDCIWAHAIGVDCCAEYTEYGVMYDVSGFVDEPLVGEALWNSFNDHIDWYDDDNNGIDRDEFNQAHPVIPVGIQALARFDDFGF